MDSEIFDVARPSTEGDQNSIQRDTDGIKKLIIKGRREDIRKRREDWERNNELDQHNQENRAMRKIPNLSTQNSNRNIFYITYF